MSHPYHPRRDPETGEEYLPVPVRGRELLEDPLYNKGTAWPLEERERLGILGLLPPHVSTDAEQLSRAYENYCRKDTDLERFIFLQSLMDRSEILFYRLLEAHLEEMLPIVYTPTVGQACQQFHHIFRRSRGLYITPETASRTDELLRNALDYGPIDVAVVTDGERILGLGDLGASGMGIPIGKLSLYVAAGGFHPANTLPILLDVGTDNEELRNDPLYLGRKEPRMRGEAYDRVVEAFIAGFREVCPSSLLQFEDFKKATAFRLLERYRRTLPTFNDDIQGTGAVALAGILAAVRRTGGTLGEQRILMVGAGAAGAGIARAVRAALAQDGDGVHGIYLMDSRGLVVAGREGVEGFKEEFARDRNELSTLGLDGPDATLHQVVAAVKPTVLIGTTGEPGIFHRLVIEAAAAGGAQPLVLPLSNPTSKTEAHPADVLQWSEGRAMIATGSPFPPVDWNGESRPVGQCNNVYIFPGVGLGVKISGARHVSDEMFTAAAQALAGQVRADELEAGALYPPIHRMREVSQAVASAVAAAAVDSGQAPAPSGETDWRVLARDTMWVPRHLPYRYEP